MQPRDHTVVFTISARLSENDAKALEEDFAKHGKKALATFDLNDPEKEVLLTWNFFKPKEARK